MQRLTLGSYLAKAAQAGTAMIGNPDLEQEDLMLANAATAVDPKRVNQLEAQLRKLEERLDAMGDELGEHIINGTQHDGGNSARNVERQALDTLAKAQSAKLRRLTPEGLLERGMRVLTDPSAVGVLESYVNNVQLRKAADMLADAEARADKQDEDGALERVQDQLDEHSQLATISKLGEVVSDLQHTLNSLLARIGRLESRAPAAAPAPAQTVAKAAQPFGRRQPQATDYKDSPEGLMSRLEAVFDSPAQVGALSSALQAGRVEEVRQAVERAELAHETAMKKQARRTL